MAAPGRDGAPALGVAADSVIMVNGSLPPAGGVDRRANDMRKSQGNRAGAGVQNTAKHRHRARSCKF
jgi:hypothetical protein